VSFTLDDAVVFDKKLKENNLQDFGPSYNRPKYNKKRPRYNKPKVFAESSEAFAFDHNYLNDAFFKKFFKRQTKVKNAGGRRKAKSNPK
jgi:hypothetical protein